MRVIFVISKLEPHMKTSIVITNEAYRMIRNLATNELVNSGVRQIDGSWIIQVSASVFESVERVRLEGETISDTIIRLGTLYLHKLN